jgi:hypothetical protein
MASVRWRVRGLGAGWPARSGGTRTRTYVLSARLTRSRPASREFLHRNTGGGTKLPWVLVGYRWQSNRFITVCSRVV